jgi:hypothetical protein
MPSNALTSHFYAGPNPKAFALANPGKGKRQAARSHEVRLFRIRLPFFFFVNGVAAELTGIWDI